MKPALLARRQIPNKTQHLMTLRTLSVSGKTVFNDTGRAGELDRHRCSMPTSI